MNDPFIHGVPFDQKQADQLARFFNLAFSSALLYGGGHQTSIENAGPFFTHLTSLLEGKDLLTLSVERESVFFEGWCVDKAVNQRRIVGYFKKAGLQSISFEPGVLKDEVIVLIRTIGVLQEAPSVESMKKSLVAGKVNKIRLNYVTYRKVTVDEAVVDKQILETASPLSSTGGSPRQGPRIDDIDIDLGKSVSVNEAVQGQAAPHHSDPSALIKELAPMFSLKRLFDDPKGMVDNLVNLPAHEKDRGLEYIAGQVQALNSQVRSGDAEKNFPSTHEMMEAVCKLRQELTQGLEALKATGKVFAASDEISEGLDRLSRETILRLIRDEYKSGAISVKRLAQVIRRIMPDVKEIKKLLPHLKTNLIGEGMPLSDYLQLVKSLVNELENDGLMEALSSASDEMGVSIDEVISGIKSDPGDAARLIILASEIRKGSGADSEQLSTLLTDYVERISQKLAIQSLPSGAENSDPGFKTAIKQFEDGLLNKLKSQGLQDSVMKEVQHRLMQKNRGFELPKGIFDIRATMFFLDHEIKLYQRYNAPFSTLVISCAYIQKGDGRLFAATPEEMTQILPGILQKAKKMIRDLDLVGVIGKISNDLPFIILPMTNEKGAQSVIGRLRNAFTATKVSCGGREIIPQIVATSFEFDQTKTPDCASYLREAQAFHKRQVELESSKKNGGERI